MDYVADLHLHSKYSRAVSRDMVLPTMAHWARLKGIDILSATDWTHPLWFREIRNQLEEKYEGLYRLKSQISSNKPQAAEKREPLFLLSVEIASIYSQGGKLRRIHNLVFAPNFDVVDKISKELTKRGCNLLSDGRPIIGLSSKQLLELILAIDQRAMLIPCHVWTPHFGIYGSASGFDSLDESFGEYSEYIYGIETGLSSDPEMNWQVAELINRSILSFSDAHSPAKMAREATVFVLQDKTSTATEITYEDIRLAIMRKNHGKYKIGYTIEFYPEEGKYHFSGHRNCKVVFGPEEIKKSGTICPVCKRKLTEGVLVRVEQLSSKRFLDRVEKKTSPSGLLWFTDKSKTHPPYVKIVPLLEVVAEAMEATVGSGKVRTAYTDLCNEFESEIHALLKTPLDVIARSAGTRIADGIGRIRKGALVIDPGYDGEFGKVKIFEEKEIEKEKTDATVPQLRLELER